MNQRMWTSAETERLLSLRAHGYQAAEIAEKMGRTVPSVKHRLRRLKACKPQRPRKEGQPLLEFTAGMGFLTGYELTWRVWPFCSECGERFCDGDNLIQVQPTRGPQPYYRHTECGEVSA